MDMAWSICRIVEKGTFIVLILILKTECFPFNVNVKGDREVSVRLTAQIWESAAVGHTIKTTLKPIKKATHDK